MTTPADRPEPAHGIPRPGPAGHGDRPALTVPDPSARGPAPQPTEHTRMKTASTSRQRGASKASWYRRDHGKRQEQTVLDGPASS